MPDSPLGSYEQFVPPVPAGPIPHSSSMWKWRDSRVHVEHVGDTAAPVRMLLVHGAGGNTAAMRPYAIHLSTTGARVTVPDMPGYGLTEVPDPGTVRYHHWRQMLVDLIEAEHDDRPLVIIGASMGGLLAYDAAAATNLASALVVTCLLDPQADIVRERLTWHPALARAAGPALRLLAGPLASVRIPIRWIADMRHIANNRGLVAEVLKDKRGGGGQVPLGWMRSFLEAAPTVEPEAFEGTHVLMVHPTDDRWTPLEVSKPFFDRIAAEKELVMLEGCGHFPTEEPGFTQMIKAVQRIRDRSVQHTLGHQDGNNIADYENSTRPAANL